MPLDKKIEKIKYTIIRPLVILFILLGVFFAVSECFNKPKFYVGTGEGFEDEIKITISAIVNKKGEIIINSMDVVHEETPAIGGAAIDMCKNNLMHHGYHRIDTIAGATYTSEGVQEAVDNAVAEFKKDNNIQ